MQDQSSTTIERKYETLLRMITEHGDSNDCLLWPFNKIWNGYGRVWFEKRRWLVHRLAYKLVHGKLPRALDVLHGCDVRNCFCPKHLRLGDYDENHNERIRKGRQRGGWSYRNTGPLAIRRYAPVVPLESVASMRNSRLRSRDAVAYLINLHANSPACLMWPFRKDRRGYGRVIVDGKGVGVHRVAYEITHGPFDQELMVRHSCDTPSCFNPSHLLTGSALDNTRDCIERGRFLGWRGLKRGPAGVLNHKAKLTPASVRYIRTQRSLGRTHLAIAQDLGVSESTVSNVLKGRTWTTVPSV